MARPKTIKPNVDIEEQSNNAELNEESVDVNALLKKMQEMMLEISALKKQVQNKPEEKEEVVSRVEVEETDDINIDIRADKYIKVISLCREKLNLTTEPYGKGKIFSFEKFGSTRQIMYSELVNIIHNTQRFIEEGRYYILDKAVIRKHGLLEIYENILTKEKIEQVLACNGKESLALYKSANEKQRKIIDQMLISKMRDGAEVDLNIISAISKIAGFDLYQKAEEAKQFKAITAEAENAS